MIRDVEVMVIGGGPAGLCAAQAAASAGAHVLLCERDYVPGGQLVKQTHKFFVFSALKRQTPPNSHSINSRMVMG